MGLSEEDRNLVVSETNVVFHVAATVRFDEKLSKAIAINVRGTKVPLHQTHQNTPNNDHINYL